MCNVQVNYNTSKLNIQNNMYLDMKESTYVQRDTKMLLSRNQAIDQITHFDLNLFLHLLCTHW